jgi:DNA-binding response OmpR family regulator
MESMPFHSLSPRQDEMQGPIREQELSTSAAVLTMGALRLDPEGFSVTVDGSDLALTLAEFLLLRELASHPYQVLGRERLAAALREHTSDPVPSARSVDTHISRLRRKLHLAGYDCIKTMRFVGYRFVPV